MFEHYAWAGGREAILRLGPADAPLVLIAPALFEEANRTRAFTVAVMRRLAERGIASALPDLPGTNESLLPTDQARFANWRAAFAACASERTAFGFAIRGGALVDGEAMLAGRCHLSPVPGRALVRDLVRARLAGRAEGDSFDPAELGRPGPPIELAGNLISRELLAELGIAEPSEADRVLRLDADPGPADVKLPGRTLWRAVEPDCDAPLAERVAAELADWVRSCVS